MRAEINFGTRMTNRRYCQISPALPYSACIGRRDAALYAFPRWSVGTRY
ncbi:MAG: hypothetical protein HAW59_00770 [Betaproteobacteria bacterium]|nr:hypothetical protein [Betaproteobacteria bacterium]